MSAHENFDRTEDVQGSSDRAFGLVFAAFFAVLGLWPFITTWGHVPPRVWALAVSGGFLTLASFYPSGLRTLNRAWTKFGFILQKITNPIIMGIIFYLVLTPCALIFKILGKDPLRRRFDPGASSYWITRDATTEVPRSMENQF